MDGESNMMTKYKVADYQEAVGDLNAVVVCQVCEKKMSTGHFWNDVDEDNAVFFCTKKHGQQWFRCHPSYSVTKAGVWSKVPGRHIQ